MSYKDISVELHQPDKQTSNSNALWGVLTVGALALAGAVVGAKALLKEKEDLIEDEEE